MAKGDANFGAAGKKGYMGGKYSRKAMNLSKKELGKAGVAAARKRTVDISQTRRESGKTLGPGGKPLTGRVKMGNGNIAVYKDGKRVISQAPKKAAAPTVRKQSDKPKPPREMSPAAKKAKETRTGRRAVDTAGRAGMAMARDKSGTGASRPRVSGTVASAIASGNARGASSNSTSPQSRSGPFGPAGRIGANAGNVRLLSKIADLKRKADLAAQQQRNTKASEAARAKAKAERERLLKEIARLGGK